MKIGIDIDGVILDFERTMRFYAEYYDLIEGGSGKIDNNFSYLENYNWPKLTKEEFIENYLILGTNTCNLISGSKESLDILHQNNIEIILITARGNLNKKTKEIVANVLKKHDIYCDKIYFETTDKVRIAKELKIDFMIDDNPQICNSLKNAQVHTIYFKDCETTLKENEYVKVVTNWAEILRYLNENKIINIIG